ncbi:glycoside hydrolase family 16 protein [Babjeviella inositovora NRRL Y-12698]|uniref:Glycoside hydrolase family 16 protein n=1 Tax=Babjeviella inositovora NRRL Y-12698 TaxID=984486 RepID=A0A1E3QLK9_9ASCO|nr:glycoside hydrolase family 16 protein [Babjeviella inositovora NRRL Y-12698]ODQ78589.1 glycoside hydrolase family 16 protein [Babjeviella inositovora NRRL Y-12698]
MARNLTHQQDPFSPEPLNPFEGSDEDTSASYSDESPNYESRDSRTNLLERDGPEIQNNNILSPPGFDRYPTVALLSAGPSSSSLASSYLHPNKKYSYANYSSGQGSRLGSSNVSTDSRSDSTHFQEDVDFLPFGGFPASLFPLHIDEKEDDDYLHNPDPIADAEYENNRFKYDMKHLDRRSGMGLAGIILLALGMLTVFVVYPILTYSGVTSPGHVTPYEVLTLYEYPTLSAVRTSLVDPDTPAEYKTRTSREGEEWQLVFSDEFNAEGRTFYEGDDQFWYAPDFNYAATKDLEWYDPDAVTTANGTVQLRMDAFKNHDLYYRSGMLHSWNKMCFTQGIMEVSIRLPNFGNVTGLWPGAWSMGNLGRPGYMATTEGVWPYTYEACDAGITANQSSPDGISYLPGQKLNSCTCKGSDHPNRGVGRGAPEIDIIEGEVDTTLGVGVASQSMQIAPMDIWYIPDYNFVEVRNASVTCMNSYCGGPFQQAVSAVSTLNTSWYEMGDTEHNFQNYAYEYLNDNNDGYVTWYVGDDETFTVKAYALAPNGNVDWRRISKEPMSMILNLGISNNWAYIDWAAIDFPVTMEIDYVRIYQPAGNISLTCDPEDYPTYDYIQDHLNAYEDYNITSWEDAGYSFPKNRLTGC